MRHTPGPWTMFDRLVQGRGGAPVAAVHGPHAYANASLIAAAPELLAALKEIADECERRLRKGEDSGDRLTLQLCNAAIAKAEGRGE